MSGLPQLRLFTQQCHLGLLKYSSLLYLKSFVQTVDWQLLDSNGYLASLNQENKQVSRLSCHFENVLAGVQI